MSLTRFGRRFLPLLVVFSLLVVGGSSHAMPAPAYKLSMLTTAADATQSDIVPTPEPNGCYPGSGWTWTMGPFMPEIALEVQQELSQLGIDALVEARAFGETDSCGTFELFAIDFAITVRSGVQISRTRQEQLADELYPILVRSGKPNLGNVTITFPQGNTITLNEKTLTNQLAAATLDPSWQKASTTVSPSGRYLHGLAYDAQRHVAVLFGGDNTGSARLSDTWEFDGTNWQQVIPSQSPPGRANIDQTLVYDSDRQKVILFGGLGSSGYLNDTWEFNGTTWSQVSAGTPPPERDAHAMVFDSHHGVTILFGGYGSTGVPLNDTWQYNGTWQQVSTAQAPPSRLHHSMAYDAQRQVTVLFGGLNSANAKLADTWEYDGYTWHQVTPTESPPPRHNHSMTYDSARGVTVLFGGEGDGGLLNDTWEYDGTTWRQVSTSQSPSPNTEMSMVYDSQRSKPVFFGGGYWRDSSLTVFDDTWEYEPATEPGSPGVLNKNVYVIVYDPLLDNGQLLSEYLGWNNHADLTQGTINFFGQQSNGGMNYTVVDTTVVTDGWPEKIDGFTYTEQEYLDVISGQSLPHSPDNVNYNTIVNLPQFDICGKANRGEIDEVWIYNGPYFGFWESTLVGPGAYWYNSPPVPGPYDCTRMVPIMGPSPHVGLDNAIHNFGHRTESTMTRVYGSWSQNSTSHNWEKFALVEHLSPNYDYSGCGNIHYPPNGTSDYDYGNSGTVMSNCDDFANYPNLSEPSTVWQPVSCSNWGCSHLGFLEYWFGHLPRNAGCGPDDVANNWWRYFGEPAIALDPPLACEPLDPTLSINYATGQPGSLFTVAGSNFPVDSTATVTINGVLMGTTITTDLMGNLTFILDTSVASVGRYVVTVTVNPSMTVTFELDPAEPFRPQSGSAPIIVVPSDIAFTEVIYLPLVLR